MKLTSMFESASESPVVECSRDGEKSDQSVALLVPVSSDSCNLSSSKSKIKEDRSSPVLDMINGNGEAQTDLKKTLEPLSLCNGDGASSDDLERISCRTPVGDNDSSSEKENYLFDDGGSEASLKLRITESEDEGEMSPRATSPFEEMDQECCNQVLTQTEDHDGTSGEIRDTEPKHDDQSGDDGGGEEKEQQQEEEEGDAEESDVSGPIVKGQDDEISGKLLKSEDDDGPDTTCVQEEDSHIMHAESAGSDACLSEEHVEPEKSERCCDIASDSDTVKCSCDAVRRRRKRSIEDVVPDRISKRTRGATLASSSAANSPEKLTQTNSESAKRPVVDSSAEEDAKRMRLNEEYGKVVKRIEQTVAPNGIVTGEIGSRRVFLEKIRAKDLKNLTVAELEEFFVEKICEALAYRHELGVMRQKQQAVENQMEIWRKKSLAMCKQVRDMELVMKRYQNDLKTRKDRPVIPVKVTRSVGLQVHDISSDPSRALLHKRKRMEQQVSSVNTTQRPSPQSPLGSNISTAPTSQSASVSTRGTTSSPQYSRTATSMNSQTNTPAAGNRVPAKPNSGLKTLMPRQQSVSVNTNTSTTSPTTANSSRTQQITRSKVASSAGNSPVGSVNKNSRQVIDLTDDGDRGRSAQARTTAVMTSVNTVPASTTLTPTSSIRILPQPVTATAVAAGANILATGVTTNSTVPRLTYLVPTSNQLQQRPVLLASSPSQGVANAVVTVTSGQKNQAPAVYVKNGAVLSVSPLVGSGAVGQQVTTAARPTGLQPQVAQGSPSRPQIRPAQILTGSPQSRSLPQHAQHPAPLPVAPILNLNNPDLKKMPPRPELKISKQSRHQGIVLSWNMPVTNEYAAIASYQLYAYQESSSPPSTAHWKKVGDVKALPLPMACTLTQFVEGHKYHFAVRAVDIHSRVGPFSLPGSIVLTRK